MSLAASIEKHQLIFKFAAKTSRGTLKGHNVHLIKLWNSRSPQVVGVGESSPLAGLSPDYEFIESELQKVCSLISEYPVPNSINDIYQIVDTLTTPDLPSVRFGLETALLDLYHGGVKSIFQVAQTKGNRALPINGLIWMGDPSFMKEQIDRKVSEGYSCIKMKIGALEFEAECALLDYIRSNYNSKIILRVDANGAFKPDDVNSRLRELQEFHLHSIEQPVYPGQWEVMRDVCQGALVPVALDEELIGLTNNADREELLDFVKPQYLVLKPTLLGGFRETIGWIKLADERKIGWWLTSALESNIGLNAIAQFTSTLEVSSPQGLGTGNLYHNNIPAKLRIENGFLYF